jgi:phosphoglycolate phosphatase-like HAD superfamily hydrolase
MPLHLSRIRAICFDVDGTLNDTDDIFIRRMERLLRPMHIFFPRRELHGLARRIVMGLESPGNFLMSVPDVLGLDDEIARLNEYFVRRRPKPIKHFQLIPGISDLLPALFNRFPLAVVSARDEATTRKFIDHFGLRTYFQVIVSGQTARHTKPFPDPIFHTARVMNIPPESCLMVGDTTVDILSGRKAGAQTIGVLCGFGERAELVKAGADMILATTPELSLVLEE